MGIVISWWLAVEVLGIVGLPLTATVFAHLPGRGWVLSKPLSLLALGWLIWFPLALISALPYSTGWILGAFLVFAAGNAALLRRGDLRAALRDVLLRERVYVLAGEVLFAGAFALMAWIRSFTSAVVDTEKFMDVAFISSLWRTPHLPAPDPWLSGYPINYYYFGHFLIATIARVLGTQPGTAFNVGIALVFALTAVAIFGVASAIVAVARRRAAGSDGALVRAVPFGVASALFVLVLGNLNGAQVWWQNATQMVHQQPALLSNPWAWWLNRDLWLRYDWWSPSRVVPGTINEFPAFSFILADLHAHVLALPFAALAVGLAFNVLLARGEGLRAFGRGAAGALALIVTAVAIGGLYAINGWDLPTYLGLALLALALQQWLAHGRRFSFLLALDLISAAVLLVALCFLAYLPFYRGFVSPSQGIAPVTADNRTQIGYELAIFGLPLFIVLSLVLLRLARWTGEALEAHVAGELAAGNAGPGQLWGALDGVARTAGTCLVVAAFALFALWTLARPSITGWTLFWCILTVAACAALALRRLAASHTPTSAATVTHVTVAGGDSADDPDAGAAVAGRAELWVFCLVGTAAALVAAAEVVFLRDIFESRMNTVFKLYYQAWLLLGIAAGPALAWLLPAARARLVALLALPRRLPETEVSTPPAIGMMALDGAAARAAGALGSRRLRVAPISDHLAFATPSQNTPTVLPSSSHGGEAGGDGPQSAQREPSGGERVPQTLRWLGASGILVWMGILAVLIGASLIYPVLAASARTENFTLARTLDGTAYMATDPLNQPAQCTVVGAGSNHDDNEAIAWLNTHVTGDPVIVEAPGCEWTHYSRISAFTGLPTLLGWPGGHEGEWRVNWLQRYAAGQDIFTERAQAINAIYTNPDQATVFSLLRQYAVRYVYVGAAERNLYPTANLDRFSSFLRPVYQHDGVTIYAVPR